jgi:hypothetical protein
MMEKSAVLSTLFKKIICLLAIVLTGCASDKHRAFRPFDEAIRKSESIQSKESVRQRRSAVAIRPGDSEGRFFAFIDRGNGRMLSFSSYCCSEDSDTIVVYPQSYMPHFHLSRTSLVQKGQSVNCFSAKADLKSFCDSAFSKTNIPTTVLANLFVGAMTMGINFIFGILIHSKSFDPDSFKQAIVANNLDRYQKRLASKGSDAIDQMGLYYFFKTAFLNRIRIADHVFDYSKEEYERLFKDVPVPPSFKKAPASVQQIVDNLTFWFEQDIFSILPDVEGKPRFSFQIPGNTIIEKDDFESLAEFEDRVKKTKASLENNLRRSLEKYKEDVAKRNRQIEQYNQAVADLENLSAKHDIGQAVKDFRKRALVFAFYMVYGPPKIDSTGYDADKKLLHVHLSPPFSGSYVVPQDPRQARRIAQNPEKLNMAFRVSMEKGTLRPVSAFVQFGNSKHDAGIFKGEFLPNPIQVRVAIKLHGPVDTGTLYKEPMPEVDIRYSIADLVEADRLLNRHHNALEAAPLWFVKRDISNMANEVIGYGEGETMQEAEKKAREDAALRFGSRISGHSKYSRQHRSGYLDRTMLEMDRYLTEEVDLFIGAWEIVESELIFAKYYVAVKGTMRPID